MRKHLTAFLLTLGAFGFAGMSVHADEIDGRVFQVYSSCSRDTSDRFTIRDRYTGIYLSVSMVTRFQRNDLPLQGMEDVCSLRVLSTLSACLNNAAIFTRVYGLYPLGNYNYWMLYNSGLFARY